MWMKSIVFCATMTVVLAAVARGPLVPKPEKFKDQEGCYIPDLDAVIPVGQLTPSKQQCMGFRCGESSIAYESCSVVETDPSGKITEDTSKPYPDCCPKFDHSLPPAQ